MSRSADSAGRPWASRRFDENAYSADDGSASEELATAMARFRDGTVGQDAVVRAFSLSRLLIPLVAHAGESEAGEDGYLVDKTQELSLVTVAGPDGRSVLPVFSSVGRMTAWDSQARPVPVTGTRVALAAVSDGTDLVVLDATTDSEFGIRRPALWSLVEGRAWQPSFTDPRVALAFQESIEPELAVLSLTLEPGDPGARLLGPELVVRLALAEGLTRTELDAVLARLAQRWAADERIAAGVDSLAVQLVNG